MEIVSWNLTFVLQQAGLQGISLFVTLENTSHENCYFNSYLLGMVLLWADGPCNKLDTNDLDAR